MCIRDRSSCTPFTSCVDFDTVIINQASLIIEPLCLAPVMLGKKFLLIGDYYSLNPTIKSAEADAAGISISLFRRLCEHWPHKVVVLRHTMTMNNDIANLMNTVAYKGLIRVCEQNIGQVLNF